jgi:hypothetical protein
LASDIDRFLSELSVVDGLETDATEDGDQGERRG